MKVGQKKVLFFIYLGGLILSLGLSFYSYQEQKSGLKPLKEILSHYREKDFNYGNFQFYQEKLHYLTKGLIGKDKGWVSAFQKAQDNHIAFLNAGIEGNHQEQANILIGKQEEALKKGDNRLLIKLLKDEKRLYQAKRVSLSKASGEIQKELILGTKAILKILTYYSIAMSFLFSIFVFLINLNKKSVQKLESERKKRDFMLDSLDCAVLLLDKDLNIFSFNEKAKQVWGGSVLFKGSSFSQLLPTIKHLSDTNEIIEDPFETSPLGIILHSKDLYKGITLQLNLSTNGLQPQWFQVDAKSFKNELFLISFINTTHLMEARLLIEKQQQSLIEQSKMSALGQMSGGMAHEINNPLAIISSEAEELLEIAEEEGNVNKDDATSISQNIRATTERIAKIIRGLKVFAREDKGEDFSVRDLAEIVNEVVIMAEEKFKTKGVKFSIDFPEITNLESKEVLGNEVQIIQVLVNLLNNAYDAVKDQKDRKISFSWKVLPEHFLLVVKDNGAGIPENVRLKIFDPFFSTKKVGEGTGLGLSLSKSIIENHSGELFLGDEDEGTEFVVKLPIYNSEKNDREGDEDKKWAS